jgi:hypothetical protein
VCSQEFCDLYINGSLSLHTENIIFVGIRCSHLLVVHAASRFFPRLPTQLAFDINQVALLLRIQLLLVKNYPLSIIHRGGARIWKANSQPPWCLARRELLVFIVLFTARITPCSSRKVRARRREIGEVPRRRQRHRAREVF